MNQVSVIGYCNCGTCRSIILTCDKSLPKIPSHQRVPVEMTLSANDSVPILFLLHVIDGYVSELEVLRADSERLIHVPDCNDAIVTVNEDDWCGFLCKKRHKFRESSIIIFA